MLNPQVSFFESLKAALPSHLNLPQIVSQILGISLNEAYKKIKGTSSLSLQQLTDLCNDLDFSYHFQPEQSNNITFTSSKIDVEKEPMESYLYGILEDLKHIHQLANKHIKVTTDDIPIFHFFKYPALTAFKLFFWADSMGLSDDNFKKFRLSEEVKGITQEINQLYLEIPSTEIWAKDTVHGTIEQIRYAFEAGYLQGETADEILKELKACLVDINAYAINSSKTSNLQHTYNWYTNDVLGSICYLIESDGLFTSYNRFNTFNYIKTQDIPFCKQTNIWMDILIRKSESLSGNGEKQRNRYISDAYADIQKLDAEIKNV